MYILPGYRGTYIRGVCTFGALQPTANFSKNWRGTYFRRGTYLRGFTVCLFCDAHQQLLRVCTQARTHVCMCVCTVHMQVCKCTCVCVHAWVCVRACCAPAYQLVVLHQTDELKRSKNKLFIGVKFDRGCCSSKLFVGGNWKRTQKKKNKKFFQKTLSFLCRYYHYPSCISWNKGNTKYGAGERWL